ncbi:MAG: xanthine dehydrogenase family protein molybdopterin-binding subunit [Gammaproteobacteria bacterium]|nr:xanthine dehydrogenase family protein molybdopterin-binding subunit [Gammaproteobacteria bacterium]MYF60465.1 xanthine dehydrogenase family protein molybdopterin-binding subunit [Gammaproteobacteria bacterium]MYI23793.1 xanthine dehydrogenase family protein molybdopterin-binding subunit [Gammaproteobacteria bacterium]
MSDNGSNGTGFIGASLKRKEDARFLTGRGRYTDDINLPGQLYAHLLRSTVAHADLASVDTSAAEAAPGVHAVFTGPDMEGVGGIPTGWLIHSKDGSPMVEPGHPAMAIGKVRHVGEIVAIVVAETRVQAREAAALIDIDYQELPAVASLAAARADGAPKVWDEADGNLCYDWEVGDRGAAEAAIAGAAHTVSIDVVNQRLVPNAIEPRAAIGSFDPTTEVYTLYTTSQNPHLIRLLLGAFVLGLPEHKLRIVAPDVGGGFGSKIPHYAEEAIITWTAAQLGRPVKWTSDRSEAFVSDTQGRDHISTATLGLDEDGKFVGLKVSTQANLGAYLSTFATCVPTYLYGILFAGPYTTPAIYCEVEGVFTNTVPVDALRGAGRPEATYLLERLVDKAAAATGIDRVDIRRRNFIREFPYQTPVALQYDQGDYDATLDLALEASDWDGFEARRSEAAGRGKLRGIGISTFIEACGIAPSAVVGSLGARAGLYEVGSVRVHPTGSVSVFTGTHSHGQGHETTFAQIVAETLGVDFEAVDVVHGDTNAIPFGMGTYGSRSLAVGGTAIYNAVQKVIAKGKKIAAHLLEASEEDIEFADGNFTVAGTDRSKSIGEVALTAYVPHNYPEGLEPGLEETAFYDPLNFTFPAGTHVAEVEVDPETGVVELVAVTGADDVGRIINPMIVNGQLHGGLAHGIGQALLEHCEYDDEGQLVTGSYMNYTMPRAGDLPNFNINHNTTHCTHNPLGVKGVGEVGSIGVPPAVINAVVDALSPLGVTHIEMPATSQRVWQAIQAAQAQD